MMKWLPSKFTGSDLSKVSEPASESDFVLKIADIDYNSSSQVSLGNCGCFYE